MEAIIEPNKPPSPSQNKNQSSDTSTGTFADSSFLLASQLMESKYSQGSAPPTTVSYKTPSAPTSNGVLFLFYFGGFAVISIFLLPFIEKSQDQIRKWFSITGADFSTSNKEVLNGIKSDSLEDVFSKGDKIFLRTLEIVKQYNQANLTKEQARIILNRLTSFSKQEIEELLATAPVKDLPYQMETKEMAEETK